MDDLSTLALPPDARPYHRTPEFDETTVPGKLQHRHATKPGVWGLLQVTEGQLFYRSLGDPAAERRLGAGERQVIPPEVPHLVRLEGHARFFVEFHR